jgi:hypothetical protein
MKNRLTDIRKVVERELGVKINTPSRKRRCAYGRAVFCKVARELSTKPTLEEIGRVIGRDHSSTIHNMKTTFQYAMMDKEFQDLYDLLKKMFVEELEPEVVEQALDLQRENDMLKHKLAYLARNQSRFDKVVDGLYQSEIEQIFEKLEIMAKMMKKQTYA